MSRQKSIHDIIKAETDKFIKDKEFSEKSLDALSVSVDLKLDRSNVSRDLNKLWKDGLLIKVQGKPTLFLDYGLISNTYSDRYIPTVIGKNELLSNYLYPKEVSKQDDKSGEGAYTSDDLDSLIGSEGSMKEAALLAKSAVSYPPRGLHTLIYGKTGSGKRNFADCIYNYAIKEKIRDRSAPYITVSCHNFSDNPALFAKQLLGTAKDVNTGKSRRGFFDMAKGGFLFFDGIEYLSPASLDLIASVAKRGSYNRIGESTRRELSLMIIASAAIPLSEIDSRELAEAMPIYIKLPDLDDRKFIEKAELILNLFSQEAAATRSPLKLPKDILLCFALSHFHENITGLRNEIKSVCSKAYLDSFQNGYKTVYIGYHNLSPDMLSGIHGNSESEGASSLLSEIPYDYIMFDEKGRTDSLIPLKSFSGADEKHGLLPPPDMPSEDNSLSGLGNYVMSNIKSFNKIGSLELQNIKKSIYPIVARLTVAELQKQGIYENYKKHMQLLYGMLLHITNFIKDGTRSDADDALRKPLWIPESDAPPVSKKLFPKEYKIASTILLELQNIYHMRFSVREIDFLTSYLSILGNWSQKQSPGILVICHGNSTASDMADYVKANVKGNFRIDSINFKEGISLSLLLSEAAKKAAELNTGAGVLILTDMEPLTSINDLLLKTLSIPTRLIHPVTLSFLIKATEKVSRGAGLDEFTSVYDDESELPHPAGDISDNFIYELAEKVIRKTVVFIDVKKALFILDHCLKGTLNDLQRPYTNEIAAKYLCHCCNMLERVIKCDQWKYSNLKSFINMNYKLMHIVEHNLEYAENTLGINISSGEIAYITEIFRE